MTEEMKEAIDATRFVVVEFGNGNNVEQGFKIKAAFDNEPEARKFAEEIARDKPGERYGLFQKLGTATAALEVKWKTSATGGKSS